MIKGPVSIAGACCIAAWLALTSCCCYRQLGSDLQCACGGCSYVVCHVLTLGRVLSRCTKSCTIATLCV